MSYCQVQSTVEKRSKIFQRPLQADPSSSRDGPLLWTLYMEAVGWGIVFYKLNQRQFNVFVSDIIVNLPVHLSSTTISIIFCFFVFMHVQKHTQKIPFGDGQLHRSIVVGCIGSIDNLRFCIQCNCSYLGLKEWSKAWVHYCEFYLSRCLCIIVLFNMYYGACGVH